MGGVRVEDGYRSGLIKGVPNETMRQLNETVSPLYILECNDG